MGTKQMLRSPLFIIVALVLTWFSITFLILPNVNLLKQVFFPDGQFSNRAFEKLLSSQRAKSALVNSFILAFALAISVNIIGVFVVLVTRYFDIRGAKILFLGYATTLIYGGIVLVAGYRFIYGSNGILTNLLSNIFPNFDTNWFQGMWAVIFVMTFAGTSNHILFLNAAIAKVDYQTIEAAKQMGASNFKILRTVVLPVLKPTMFALTILTFLGGLGALAAPQILGGRDFQTITPMILTFASTPGSRDLAATLALILGAATLIMLFGLNRLEKGGTYFSVSKVPVALKKQKIENPLANFIVHSVAYLLFIIYAIPPVLITLFSFTNAQTINSGRLTLESFTLENYLKVLTDPNAYWPFIVSVGYSATAAFIVIFGLLFVARIISKYRNPISEFVEYILHIPWVLPNTMIALGLLLTFDRPQPLIGSVVLTGTIYVLAIAYVIGKIPFTLRILKAAFAGISNHLEEAASMLGASSLYTFRKVIFPLVLPTAAAITALNFNSMLDDYDSAVFLAHPFYQPLGVFIKNATTGENLSDSTAITFVYTVILMVITGLTMWLVYGKGSKIGSIKRAKPKKIAEVTNKVGS